MHKQSSRFSPGTENAYVELEGDAKLTRASVGQGFTGDLEGEGSVEWLMCYREDKTAEFVGLQRFVGRLGSRSGSFVMRTQGSFDGSEAKGSLTVVAGSGTQELQRDHRHGLVRGPARVHGVGRARLRRRIARCPRWPATATSSAPCRSPSPIRCPMPSPRPPISP